MKFNLNFLIEHAKKSFEMANINKSKISNEILRMEGMSGSKTRHLYNNLCNIKDANYLEVGTWKGSSFASSLFKNNINAIAIENWSQFNGPKDEFIKNIYELCPDQKFNFFEKDSFEITKEEINSIYDSVDVFLYDGCHEYESHKNAIIHFQKFLSKYSIIIIDDWRNDGNWECVQRGTYEGFKLSNLKIHHKIEMITHQESTGMSEYWNGFGLFVCENLS